MATHSSEIHIKIPRPRLRTHVVTRADGSQIMIEVFPTGSVSVAERADKWATWGPPIQAEDMTWKD